jgi:hypothetical protein
MDQNNNNKEQIENNTSTEENQQNINVDQLLEQEKRFNKTEQWNKLNKTSKIQKLHAFSERYGLKHKLSARDVVQLKHYFSTVLDTRLNKTKDVVYDKSTQEVTDVPGLFQNPTTKSFTIRVDTSKRPSTLKSLTPKRITEKNKKKKSDADNKQTSSLHEK